MTKLGATLLLFVVIVIEGYVVLSSELLAIRQTIPFVGSGTDTVSIIIAAVLMPLAFGYHAGGRFKQGTYKGRYLSIRKKLLRNLIISQIILLIGLSHFTLNFFFSTLLAEGITNRLALVTIYSMIFLVVPVYLLGQTIPLASNYFSKERLAEITGKMLFFSTFGSFAGAVFSTLVLMSFIGVHHTATINFALLALLITLLSKNKLKEIVLWSWGIAICGAFMNSDSVMGAFNIVENNKYNTIQIVEENDETHMFLNNNFSSMMAKNGRRHAYIEFMERVGIQPIMRSNPPKDILIIGAGGFTIGHRDRTNLYDFVDIDSSLQRLAEEHLLKEKLSDNKTFHPVPARAHLMQTDKKYDVIVLDAYLGSMSIPEHLVTQEFFSQVKDALKENGVVLANFAMNGSFGNPFSRHLDNTFRSVFPHVSRHSVFNKYDLWNEADQSNNANTIYIYKDHANVDAEKIYTDNKNTIFMDKPQKHYVEEE